MDNREIPCGTKLCNNYVRRMDNHCAIFFNDELGGCENYTPDPTELAIQIQDCGNTNPPKNGR